LGGIDIVMNNAGVGDYKKVVDMEESFWDNIMDVNLKAPFLVSKFTLPAMIEQGTGGVQLFNASTNAKTADAEWTAYNTTKHGLVGFVRCLAAEVGPEGIRVNAICPGWIDTKMAVDLHHEFAKDMKEPYEKVFDESMRLNMLSEIIPAQAVADMAVFLAGPGGTYVTGQAINVCAGLSVH
ncbi:MAG: SDR family oxidoreductase, partial [Rhodospirillaceae bacterium]|nr:SDR family oxidoreductase [Rhodospirillaceae bacterium]